MFVLFVEGTCYSTENSNRGAPSPKQPITGQDHIQVSAWLWISILDHQKPEQLFKFQVLVARVKFIAPS